VGTPHRRRQRRRQPNEPRNARRVLLYWFPSSCGEGSGRGPDLAKTPPLTLPSEAGKNRATIISATMSYISSTKNDAYLGGFGCGPGCGCAPCRSGSSNLSEWYERDDDDDEPVKPVPQSAPAQVSPPAPRLTGWGRPGLGFYGPLGFFSQAPAVAPPALVQPRVIAQLPAAGPGFYTYYATDARGRLDSPPGYHRYALPEVVRALQSIAAEWHRLHPLGPRIGFGDLSLLGGGPTPRHGAHRSGLEADIRPLRTDGRELAVTYTDPGYSLALTQQVVDLIKRNPVLRVRVILFNDSGVRGVTSFAGHNNHLHVGFLPLGPQGPPGSSPRSARSPAVGPARTVRPRGRSR
jgi:hypothetical protein